MTSSQQQMGVELEGTSATTTVPFCCQTCFAPLKLHSSLKGLQKQAMEGNTREIASVSAPLMFGDVQQANEINAQNYEKVQQTLHRPTIEEMDENVQGDGSATKDYEAAMSLFDYVSSRTDFDHPLCESCTDIILDRLDAELQNLQSQHADQDVLRKELNAINTQNEDAVVNEEIEALSEEEKSLLAEIKREEEEHARLLKEQRELDEELKGIEKKEEKYWREFNEYQRQLIEFDQKQETIEHKYEQAKKQLQVLKKTNVFNDFFHIWFDGHFGTINGFRLGRLPTVPVIFLFAIGCLFCFVHVLLSVNRFYGMKLTLLGGTLYYSFT
eukprot:m.112106 g.112106  ORF g.112106 m.112106 type:complete len:328 (-) comp12777_c0_seq2:775-1758(-)